MPKKGQKCGILRGYVGVNKKSQVNKINDLALLFVIFYGAGNRTRFM